MAIGELEYADGAGLALVVPEQFLPLRTAHPSSLLIEESLSAWRSSLKALSRTNQLQGQVARVMVKTDRAVLGISRVWPSIFSLGKGACAFVVSQMCPEAAESLPVMPEWENARVQVIEVEMAACRHLGWSVVPSASALREGMALRRIKDFLAPASGSASTEPGGEAAIFCEVWAALGRLSRVLGHGSPRSCRIESTGSALILDGEGEQNLLHVTSMPIDQMAPRWHAMDRMSVSSFSLAEVAIQ